MVNDFTKGLVNPSVEEAWKNAGPKREGAVKIPLRKAIVGDIELARGDSGQADLADAKGIQTRNVVTSSLVGAGKKLDLQVVNDVRGSSLRTRDKRGNSTTLWDGGGCLE